jgi:hypothetical protein
LSSTTDLRHLLGERAAHGQILPLFAGALFVLLLVAALVFDVGQVLFQRRAQQDAADAAALAGARWMVDGATNCKASPSTANCSKAVSAARAIAEQHGFDLAKVRVNVPPVAPSSFAGARGHIMVTIDDTHDSWFAGLLGMFNMDVSALAVAANTDGYSFPYSLLALAPDCDGGSASSIGGNGTVTVGGAMQVNATGCSSGSFTVNGGGAGTSLELRANGCYLTDEDPFIGYKPNGGVAVDCGSSTLPTEGVAAVPDPLSELDINLSTLATAAPPLVYDGTTPADPKDVKTWKCPGSPNEGTAASPATCTIQEVKDAAVTNVVLSPGIYWGGISVGSASATLNVYMRPGVYAFAGGGFAPGATGGGTYNLRTIDNPASGALPPYALGGGVLMYNTDHPRCAVDGTGCMGAIKVTGGIGTLELLPYQHAPYENLLIYQDRSASDQKDIQLTGTGAMVASGTIYAPGAEVRIAGQGAGISAQVIAYNFTIEGNGTLNVTYQADGVYKLTGVGLVQ